MDLAATSLSLIATEKHLKSLLSILSSSSDPIQQNSVVYAISFLSNYQGNHEVISTLTEVAANIAEAPFVRAQALEGIGNKLSDELPENLYQPAMSVIILKTGCSFSFKIAKSIDIQRFLPGQKSSNHPFLVYPRVG